MDAEGARIAVEVLLEKDPAEFRAPVFVADGDVHEKRWKKHEAAAPWICGLCGCHKGKNIPKATKGGAMSGRTCTCTGNPNGNACTNMTGYRWKDEWGYRIMGKWYDTVDRAVAMYLPELSTPDMDMPRDVGSPEREERRKAAVQFLRDETMGMYYHIIGDCKKEFCTHGPLPADHATLRCDAQKNLLMTVLTTLADCADDVLSPFGRLDINVVESLNSLVAKWRRKGKWGAVQCFVGEILAFLHWQRLQLGFQGVMRNPLADFASLVKEQLGLDIGYTSEELRRMDLDLDKKLSAKEKRSSAENVEKVKAARARRIGYKRLQRQGSVYLSGGSAEALEALAQVAEGHDWLHEDGPPEDDEGGLDEGEVGGDSEGEEGGEEPDMGEGGGL